VQICTLAQTPLNLSFNPPASSLDNIFNGLSANSFVMDSTIKNSLFAVILKKIVRSKYYLGIVAACDKHLAMRLNPGKLATLKIGEFENDR